jgi:biotin carboxyl carrier protein
LDLIIEIGTENEKIAVEVSSAGSVRKVRIGDTEIACDWIRLGDRHYSLILDGRVYDLLIHFDAETCEVASRAAVYNFRVTDPRRSRLKQAGEDGHIGRQRICADMPGKVIRVLVKKGDSVVPDQGLIILEAMKMQNEIRSSRSGIVADIGVSAGTTVNTGDFLLRIE